MKSWVDFKIYDSIFIITLGLSLQHLRSMLDNNVAKSNLSKQCSCFQETVPSGESVAHAQSIRPKVSVDIPLLYAKTEYFLAGSK